MKKSTISLKKFGILRILIISLTSLSLLLSSCHSEYVCLNYETHPGAQWNNQHNQIVFFVSRQAFRNAKGIARFPDGGHPDYLLEEVGLYLYNTDCKQLLLLQNLGEVCKIIGSYPSNWKSELKFQDSLIYYHITPLSGWNRYLKMAKNADDSLTIETLRQKYSSSFSVNPATKQVQKSDSASDMDFHEYNSEDHKIGLTDLNGIISVIPMEEWDLKIKDIYNKTDEEYIKETIFLYNSCPLSRRAVIEQIIAKLSSQEIEQLLREMDNYKNSLEGLEKTEYEIYSEDTYNQIRELL